MSHAKRSPLFLLLAVCGLALSALPIVAADKVWSGGGGNSNWSTGANWGGAAPVNNDNLVFTGTIQPNNSNDLSNLVVGWVSFGHDGFGLNGNALTVNGGASTFFTNAAGVSTIGCPLITGAPSGKYWFLAPNSELRLTGALTNTAGNGSSIGWLNLTNGGTVRILASARSTRGMDLFQGTVVIDGAAAVVDANNDGLRFKPPTGSMAALVVTNEGTLRIGGGGNLRLGHNGTGIGGIAGPGSVSRVDLSSGTIELYGANVNIFVGDLVAGAKGVFNQNGGLVWGSAGSGNVVTIGNSANADGTYNLNGGTLWIAQVRQGNASATNAVFNFNGGTLKPTGNSTTFMQGLLAANVQNGGAVIDSSNFNITIAQNLQAAGTGGLTKQGSGVLTLSGINTYSGSTVVSDGTLAIDGDLSGNGSVIVAGGTLGGGGSIAGAVTVQPAGTLAPGTSIGTLTLQSNLTLAGGVVLELDKSTTNDFVRVNGVLSTTGGTTFYLTNLGPALVAGDAFRFFNQPVANGDSIILSPASPGPGLAWTNKLAIDGSVGVVSTVILPTPADLVGLTLNAGTLTPAFDSNVLSYAASAPFSNRTLILTPTAANPAATIRVISAGVTNAVSSGTATAPISLKAGLNPIAVQVTAPDNSLTKVYQIAFTRTPPNVVVVLADDQGFSDWSCYGSEIATPNLDRLAAGGLRFRQFYNTARCSTTRCALLTGLYTHQVAVDPSQALPNLRNDNNVTIAELLKANGYRTYMAGKWHLGNGALLPEARGFDQVWRYANGTSHSEDTWNSNLYTFVSADGEVTNRTYAPGQFYQPDVLGDYAVDFVNHDLETHTNDKPFFLYMAFGSAHFPIQAPLSWVSTNVPIYSAGWDAVRDARYANVLAAGVLDARYLLSPNEGTAPWSGIPVEVIPAWNTLASDRQADLAQRMAIYAAMVQKFDENVGRVVARLRAAGQLDNTIIFAMSDNGGNHEGAVFGQTGGVPNATPLTGAALSNMGLSGQPVIYLGGGWAHVSDTPFRLFKHFTHEGGIRSPLIIHWPDGLTRTNQWSDQAAHLIDVMATIVDVTGASYPTQYNNHVVLPLEGQSLQPGFNATNRVTRQLGFEHEGNRAWLSGTWKFVTKNFASLNGGAVANDLELYDLSNDAVELTNLAAAQPVLLGQMVTNWNAWATRVGVPSSRLVTFTTPQPVSTPATNGDDLLVDTFARPNNTDIDASAGGTWGSRVPPLGANALYYEGFEGSGAASSIQIVSSNLQMAVGAGMSESGIMHNFVGADIVAAGGFSVELNVQEINTDPSDAANRYAGFGVGLSSTEAASGWDINSALSGGAVAFRGSQTGNTGVADCFVELDLNGNVKVWNNGTLLETVPVGQNTGVLTASFELAGFATSDLVTVKVFFNGHPVDINSADTNSLSRTFHWDRANSNYLGLSARASNFVRMNNLAIRKLPVAAGLIIDYALRHGLTGPATAVQADPDGDGVTNFGEWAFGGDPAAGDPLIASLKALVISGNFQFEFQRLSNAAQYGLQFRYFVSEDLQTWTEVTPALVAASSNEDNPGYELATLQVPPSATAGRNRLFLRVRSEPIN